MSVAFRDLHYKCDYLEKLIREKLGTENYKIRILKLNKFKFLLTCIIIPGKTKKLTRPSLATRVLN